MKTHSKADLVLFIQVIVFLALCKTGWTSIIYSTYGPDPYVRNEPVHIFEWDYDVGFGNGGGRSIAAPFSFTGSYYRLDSITLDIGRNVETTPNLEIGIYGEENGHPSLTPISLLQPDPTFTTSGRNSITYSFSNPSVLQAEVHYWVVMQPKMYAVSSDAYNCLYLVSSSTVANGFAARTISYPGNSSWGDWTVYDSSFPGAPSPVFRLDGTAVPEPSTWALFALGSALFWGIARRRRK